MWTVQSAQSPEGLKPTNIIPDAAKTQKSKHGPFLEGTELEELPSP